MTDFAFNVAGITAQIRGKQRLRDGGVRAAINFIVDGNVIFSHSANWTDAVDRGAVAEELGRRLSQSPQVFSEDLQRLKLAIAVDDNDSSDTRTTQAQEPSWPEHPGSAAFTGFSGRVVAAIDPHTESDGMALLANFLVAFGSAIGSGPHLQVGAVRHGLNLFAALVGDTSKARKGDSWPPVATIFGIADPDWQRNRVVSGLSSGEGLTWQVRDPIEKNEPIKTKGIITGYQKVIVDDGVEDKRLLVGEPEFARVLSAISRTGNTLSAVVRHAWDNGDLNTLTKNSPAKATGAHVSIIGHITESELRREMADIEVANGFANRFLWFCVRRSKFLPEPEPFNGPTVNALAIELRHLLAFARNAGELRRDADARAMWAEVYYALSDARAGLVGSIVARAEAQVTRLSAIYALLDGSILIKPTHLAAALELWGYCERSAAYIWADSLGDPIADTIVRTLRTNGRMSRTELSALFSHHLRPGQMDAALQLLVTSGHVRSSTDSSGGGRPVEHWEPAA